MRRQRRGRIGVGSASTWMALAAVGSMLVVVATPSQAGACVTGQSTRLGGVDRMATAIDISVASYPTDGSATAAVLSRSDDYADALAGVPLASFRHGPLLLTPSARLDRRVRDELVRAVRPSATVFILGGPAAIGSGVEEEVRSLGFSVQRVGGQDRYDTAVQVARAMGNRPVVLLATGRNFPDAMVAGPAAVSVGGVVLLTDDDRLPQATADYLQQHDAFPSWAFGDQAAKAYPRAEPIAGADRYETALIAARRFFGGKTTGPTGLDSTGTDPKAIAVTTGLNWPDALAGGPFVANSGGGPILLSLPHRLSEATATYIGDRSGTLTTAAVLGSEDVVGREVKDRVDQEIVARCGP